nr:mucin-7-like [Nicotiana tomentosiformis]
MGVEPRDFNTKVRAKKPFSWYSFTGGEKKGQPTTTAGQSDEPSMVAAKSADMPCTSAVPSTSAASMPPPPSTSVPPTSTLSVVAAQSSTPAPLIPPTVEDTLKKILENQTTIMNTLVAHRSVIEELGKQIAAAGELPFDLLIGSDPPASAAPSVPMAPVGQSEEPDMATDTAEAVRHMFTLPVTPRAEDDEIQLEETEGGDAAIDTAT